MFPFSGVFPADWALYLASTETGLESAALACNGGPWMRPLDLTLSVLRTPKDAEVMLSAASDKLQELEPRDLSSLLRNGEDGD